MGRERHRAAGGRGARRLAAALLLAVAGGALVMVDATLNGMPLVSDPAGYALVAVAGVLLTAEPVTAVAGGRFQHVGVAAIAVVSTAVFGQGWAVHAEDTPLVIPVVIAAFAVLAYAAWAVLATRQQILRRVAADEPHPRERGHAAAARGARVHPPR